MTVTPLDLAPLMRPRSIAVVGASQREVRANRVIRTLQAVGFAGAIFPINPNYPEVLGLPCYPDVASTPVSPDLVVIAIPAPGVADVLAAASDAGVPAAIVLASGFAEAGEKGRVMQARLEALARDRGLLICGPNCFGILNVVERIAPFIGVLADPLVAGGVGLVSQSGGLTNIVVPPLMEQRGVGFSAIVSCGNQAGVTVEDFMSHLVDDDATEVVVAFVEGFKRPAALGDIADRARRRGKPVVVLKVGRSEVAERAALAHTGSLVGSASAAEAAFRRHGIVQVQTVDALIETIALFSDREIRGRFARGRTPGPARAAVMTTTGGLVGYVGDVASDLGLALPALADETKERLGAVLPDFAGAANPLDATGAVYDDPSLFGRMLAPLADDPGIDVVAVNLDFTRVPRGPDIPRSRFVPSIVELAPNLRKPIVVVTSRSGATSDAAMATALRDAHVPVLDGIDTALTALRGLARYADALATTHRNDEQVASEGTPLLAGLPEGATGLLDTPTAMRLLEDAGITVAPVELVRSEDEAVEAARHIGMPVALKAEAAGLTHKSDMGGVVLGIAGPDAVRDAYRRIVEAVRRHVRTEPEGVLVQRMGASGLEMLLGAKLDPSFGPIVACGLGGIHTETLRDVVVGIPPLSAADGLEMLQRLRSWPLLEGRRGAPRGDVPALCHAISALGTLALALGPRLRAIDINPVLVYPEGAGALAVDVLVEIG